MNMQDIPRGILAVRSEGDLGMVLASLQQAFADFRTANQKQLDDLKAGLPASDQAERIARFEADISTLQAEVDRWNALAVAGQLGAPGAVQDREYTDAFLAHMRRGDVVASLNKGSDADGGYLAPTEWDRTITNKLAVISPMRQIARVQPVSVAGFSKLFNTGGTSSGWVGETAARPQTNTAQFASLNFTSGEIYANPAATQQMLDDSAINLETWLGDEVNTEFATQEGKAFVDGDGDKKPTGIMRYITGGTKAAAHPFGAIELVLSGAAATITADGLIDLVYSLPAAFTANAKFIMNRKTLGILRKLKDGDGNHLWQPSFVAGQPSTLLGFPVVEVADMPDVAAGSVPILFGDFYQSYLILDRVGVRVLRDPYTNKPYVMFYTTKRVGGGLLNPQPVRGLKIAAE